MRAHPTRRGTRPGHARAGARPGGRRRSADGRSQGARPPPRRTSRPSSSAPSRCCTPAGARASPSSSVPPPRRSPPSSPHWAGTSTSSPAPTGTRAWAPRSAPVSPRWPVRPTRGRAASTPCSSPSSTCPTSRPRSSPGSSTRRATTDERAGARGAAAGGIRRQCPGTRRSSGATTGRGRRDGHRRPRRPRTTSARPRTSSSSAATSRRDATPTPGGSSTRLPLEDPALPPEPRSSRRCSGWITLFTSADDVTTALGGTGYLADEALATVTFLATRLNRPILLEGEPGTGKTALAEALAQALDLPLIRLQCYEGIDATQALYDWDFPRQILHLRTVEAARAATSTTIAKALEAELFDERFLLARPVLEALRASPVRPAHRRDRPRRRRVRGLPARGALDVAGDDPRARHHQRRHAADRRAHLQPHPRAARRAQAPLPLPLDRPPRPGPRARRSCAPALPEVARRPRRAGRHPRPAPARPRRAHQAARASPRRSTGRAPCETVGATRLDAEVAAATLGAALKYREDSERIRASLDKLLTA